MLEPPRILQHPHAQAIDKCIETLTSAIVEAVEKLTAAVDRVVSRLDAVANAFYSMQKSTVYQDMMEYTALATVAVRDLA